MRMKWYHITMLGSVVMDRIIDKIYSTLVITV